MGWHYHLTLECKVLPDYHDFIQKEYLTKYTCLEREYDQEELAPEKGEIPELYDPLIDEWITSGIGLHFYEYSFSESGTFRCVIVKKVIHHVGDLEKDYLYFVKKVLVPITSEITVCQIESDDFCEFIHQYTDSYLRNNDQFGDKYKPSYVTIFDT
jgi:hypothetical protein